MEKNSFIKSYKLVKQNNQNIDSSRTAVAKQKIMRLQFEVLL